MDVIGYALAQQAARKKSITVGGSFVDSGQTNAASPIGPIAVIGNTLYRSLESDHATWQAVDIVTGQVTARANLPLASWATFDPHRMAATLAGSIHALHSSGAHQLYDPVTDTWTAKASWGGSIKYLSADGSYLYAGAGGGIPKRYNAASNSWANHGSAAVGNNISGQQYAADVDGKVWAATTSGVQVWDPVTQTITTKAAHPVTQYGVKLFPTRESVYALGGDDNSSTEHAHHYRLNIAANTWQYIGGSQPDGRNGHSTFPLPDGSGGVSIQTRGFGYSEPTGLLVVRESAPDLSTLLAHLAAK